MAIDQNQLTEAAAPNTLAGYLARLPQPHHPGHSPDGSIETVREDEYAGHSIVVRTTYHIEVDGRTLQTPLTLGNDGQLHCHALPNYQFTSAIDLVKSLIENFPEDFPQEPASGEPAGGQSGHGEQGHGEEAR
jgi:hypothetical protein